jgi:hypothetical protein
MTHEGDYEHREPPAERGHKLATFDRSKREGPATQLRVSLDEFEGHQYIRVQAWQKNRSGQWWPVKGGGFTIRLREADDWLAAIKRGVSLADRQDAAPADRRDGERGPRRQFNRDEAREVTSTHGEQFDEFAT